MRIGGSQGQLAAELGWEWICCNVPQILSLAPLPEAAVESHLRFPLSPAVAQKCEARDQRVRSSVPRGGLSPGASYILAYTRDRGKHVPAHSHLQAFIEYPQRRLSLWGIFAAHFLGNECHTPPRTAPCRQRTASHKPPSVSKGKGPRFHVPQLRDVTV